ncbi:MAG: hypothetical protein ACRDZR_02215 [Acidimicrobiales bacterium]
MTDGVGTCPGWCVADHTAETPDHFCPVGSVASGDACVNAAWDAGSSPHVVLWAAEVVPLTPDQARDLARHLTTGAELAERTPARHGANR